MVEDSVIEVKEEVVLDTEPEISVEVKTEPSEPESESGIPKKSNPSNHEIMLCHCWHLVIQD